MFVCMPICVSVCLSVYVSDKMTTSGKRLVGKVAIRYYVLQMYSDACGEVIHDFSNSLYVQLGVVLAWLQHSQDDFVI